MTRIGRLIAALVTCASPILAQAEMYITVGPLDSVLVGDHLQNGVGFESTRELSGDPLALSDPGRVQVYTGTELGGDSRGSRLLVCDQDRILAFFINAAGDVLSNTFTSMSWTGDAPDCDDFIVHRGYYYLEGADAGTLQAYPYAPFTNANTEPARVLTDFPPRPNFLSIKPDGKYLYALTSFNDVVRWDLELSRDERLGLVAQEMPGCPTPWGTLEAHQGILYVTSGVAPDAVVCVIAADNGRLLRVLSHSGFQSPHQLMVSGDELFVLDRGGIYAFDLGAGGPVPPKRVIETGEVEYIWVTQQAEPIAPTFELALEEPVDGGVHSGIGNLRGWAVASEGVSKVDIFVDGELFQSAPYGGSRADVGGVFPDVADSGASGFSLAYNYGALGAGEHIILARAETRTGEIKEASATFTATRPGQEFIPGADAVDLSGASCSINQGRSVLLEDITIDGGGPWDALLEWQPAAQAFEAQTYIFNADGI